LGNAKGVSGNTVETEQTAGLFRMNSCAPCINPAIPGSGENRPIGNFRTGIGDAGHPHRLPGPMMPAGDFK
jgi:hypothetical protein